jgi:hypothetical protein
MQEAMMISSAARNCVGGGWLAGMCGHRGKKIINQPTA